MGHVHKPEDLSARRVLRRRVPDLPPIPTPTPTLDALLQEVQSLRVEVEKIKRALREHGVSVE